MTRAEMEARRVAAIPDIDAWKNPCKLARMLQVSRTTLYRWKRERAAGEDLKSKRAPGRPERMTGAQTEEVIGEFHDGPPNGAKKWTQKQFAKAIEKRTGIKFHPDHAGRIMHRLGLIPKRKREQ